MAHPFEILLADLVLKLTNCFNILFIEISNTFCFIVTDEKQFYRLEPDGAN